MATGPDDYERYDPSHHGGDTTDIRYDTEGNRHVTVHSSSGGQVSWDEDEDGNYKDGSIHMSDRNTGGNSVWWGKD